MSSCGSLRRTDRIERSGYNGSWTHVLSRDTIGANIADMTTMTHEEIRTAISKDCTEAQFKEMRCPKCGSGLILAVHPEMHEFSVRCESDTTHLMMHGQNDNAPMWWTDYVRSKGWY